MAMEYDFAGWATKANMRCSDGRTIMKNAFKDNDGVTVPLVWNHQHNLPENVLGHALLENREDGVYAYCKFNDTESGQNAKLLVKHGDVKSLSIYANQLKEKSKNVFHGMIREVSLVLAGANPGANIDVVMEHSMDSDEAEGDGVIACDEPLVLEHADIPKEETKEESEAPKEKNEMANNEKTVQDVFDTMSEEQKLVVYALIQAAIEGEQGGENEEDEDVKHNVFENDYEENSLSHAEMTDIFDDAHRGGSLKDSCLAHGITDIETYLFPEMNELNKTPEFIKRESTWVGKVMNATHHTPFSRVRTTFADITADEARAKGYVKGNQKIEEVFTLLKRETTPQTIYKLQKLHRDDVIDITDFDVVAWIKGEMREMLNEEIARAVLVGDGRSTASNDKIKEDCVRPIWKDQELFTIHAPMSVKDDASEAAIAKDFIRTAIHARKDYKGSGTPTLYTTESMLTMCLLLEDGIGHLLYDSPEKLANVLRVKEIVTVPVMENVQVRHDSVSNKDFLPMGLIVNLADYSIGADKGGAVSMFDDFDINYNKYEYLIETRISGALIKPKSAIAIEIEEGDENLAE